MEQHCDKHNQLKPCQQCAKEAVWEGEVLVFKRDAKREIIMSGGQIMKVNCTECKNKYASISKYLEDHYVQTPEKYICMGV
jgi:endogenous inhibitor of DNA gyrase (YacG/DUF329 family)